MTYLDCQPNDPWYTELHSELIFDINSFVAFLTSKTFGLFILIFVYTQSFVCRMPINILFNHEIPSSMMRRGDNWNKQWFGSKYPWNLFIWRKIRSECNPLLQVLFGWPSWQVIHHIKPTQGGYLEPKYFQDTTTFGWEKYYITISLNFWTPCMKIMPKKSQSTYIVLFPVAFLSFHSMIHLPSKENRL